MANTVISLKKSATPSASPIDLANGEIAINYADGILYYKSANGSIASISTGTSSFGSVNANGTLILADALNDVLDIRSGSYVEITGDAINDRITISANVKEVYDTANAAFDKANNATANAFTTISSLGQSNVVASVNDTLTFNSGTNINITTNAESKSVTISAFGLSNTDYGSIAGTTTSSNDYGSI